MGEMLYMEDDLSYWTRDVEDDDTLLPVDDEALVYDDEELIGPTDRFDDEEEDLANSWEVSQGPVRG